MGNHPSQIDRGGLNSGMVLATSDAEENPDAATSPDSQAKATPVQRAYRRKSRVRPSSQLEIPDSPPRVPVTKAKNADGAVDQPKWAGQREEEEPAVAAPSPELGAVAVASSKRGSGSGRSKAGGLDLDEEDAVDSSQLSTKELKKLAKQQRKADKKARRAEALRLMEEIRSLEHGKEASQQEPVAEDEQEDVHGHRDSSSSRKKRRRPLENHARADPDGLSDGEDSQLPRKKSKIRHDSDPSTDPTSPVEIGSNQDTAQPSATTMTSVDEEDGMEDDPMHQGKRAEGMDVDEVDVELEEERQEEEEREDDEDEGGTPRRVDTEDTNGPGLSNQNVNSSSKRKRFSRTSPSGGSNDSSFSRRSSSEIQEDYSDHHHDDSMDLDDSQVKPDPGSDLDGGDERASTGIEEDLPAQDDEGASSDSQTRDSRAQVKGKYDGSDVDIDDDTASDRDENSEPDSEAHESADQAVDEDENTERDTSMDADTASRNYEDVKQELRDHEVDDQAVDEADEEANEADEDEDEDDDEGGMYMDLDTATNNDQEDHDDSELQAQGLINEASDEDNIPSKLNAGSLGQRATVTNPSDTPQSQTTVNPNSSVDKSDSARAQRSGQRSLRTYGSGPKSGRRRVAKASFFDQVSRQEHATADSPSAENHVAFTAAIIDTPSKKPRSTSPSPDAYASSSSSTSSTPVPPKTRLRIRARPKENTTPALKSSGTQKKRARVRSERSDRDRNNSIVKKKISEPSPLEALRGPMTKEEKAKMEDAIYRWGEIYRLSRDQLVDIINQNPQANRDLYDFWEYVQRECPLRKRRQVMESCRRILHNFSALGSWTEEQSQELTELYRQYGKDYARIAELINRHRADVRTRIRDFVIPGENRHKDRWTPEEVSQLVRLVNEAKEKTHKARVRKGSKDHQHVTVNWALISAKMGHVRSRIQCLGKWREIEAKINNGLMGDVLGKSMDDIVARARDEAEAISHDERYEIVKAIKSTGAKQFSRIPWRKVEFYKFGKATPKKCRIRSHQGGASITIYRPALMVLWLRLRETVAKWDRYHYDIPELADRLMARFEAGQGLEYAGSEDIDEDTEAAIIAEQVRFILKHAGNKTLLQAHQDEGEREREILDDRVLSEDDKSEEIADAGDVDEAEDAEEAENADKTDDANDDLVGDSNHETNSNQEDDIDDSLQLANSPDAHQESSSPRPEPLSQSRNKKGSEKSTPQQLHQPTNDETSEASIDKFKLAANATTPKTSSDRTQGTRRTSARIREAEHHTNDNDDDL